MAIGLSQLYPALRWAASVHCSCQKLATSAFSSGSSDTACMQKVSRADPCVDYACLNREVWHRPAVHGRLSSTLHIQPKCR